MFNNVSFLYLMNVKYDCLTIIGLINLFFIRTIHFHAHFSLVAKDFENVIVWITFDISTLRVNELRVYIVNLTFHTFVFSILFKS